MAFNTSASDSSTGNKLRLPSEHAGNWRGDYSAVWCALVETFPTLKLSGEVIHPGELSNVEFFFANHLRKILDLKKDGPVIALDVGGMMGISWIKLAKHFEKEIAEGRMAFVVSNLTDARKDDEFTKTLKAEERGFLDENEHLVHFVVAGTEELSAISITTPQDNKIKLSGNVDLLLEKMSVTVWSDKPIIEIPRLGKLTSIYGSYFVTIEDVENSPRGEEVLVAFHILEEELGYRKVTKVEEGKKKETELQYFVYQKSLAPKIDLD